MTGFALVSGLVPVSIRKGNAKFQPKLRERKDVVFPSGPIPDFSPGFLVRTPRVTLSDVSEGTTLNSKPSEISSPAHKIEGVLVFSLFLFLFFKAGAGD